jgi:hypothetical protein
MRKPIVALVAVAAAASGAGLTYFLIGRDAPAGCTSDQFHEKSDAFTSAATDLEKRDAARAGRLVREFTKSMADEIGRSGGRQRLCEKLDALLIEAKK